MGIGFKMLFMGKSFRSDDLNQALLLPPSLPNKRPVLADLRGSGDLAFHADAAILIHRDRGEDGASIDRRTELIIAKQRGGRTGTAKAFYNTGSLLFEERVS